MRFMLLGYVMQNSFSLTATCVWRLFMASKNYLFFISILLKAEWFNTGVFWQDFSHVRQNIIVTCRHRARQVVHRLGVRTWHVGTCLCAEDADHVADGDSFTVIALQHFSVSPVEYDSKKTRRHSTPQAQKYGWIITYQLHYAVCKELCEYLCNVSMST